MTNLPVIDHNYQNIFTILLIPVVPLFNIPSLEYKRHGVRPLALQLG